MLKASHRGPPAVVLVLLVALGLTSPLWAQGEVAVPDGFESLGDEPTRYAFFLRMPGEDWPAQGPLRVLLGYRGPGHHDALTLGADGAVLLRVRDGVAQEAARAPKPASHVARITVRRTTGHTDLIWGRERVLTAYDREQPRGAILLGRGPGNPEPDEAFVQPALELRFEADFAAEGNQMAGWETPVGTFKPSGVKGRRPRPELAANPFTYAAIGPMPALTTAGYWFWDGYEITSAVKGMDGGVVGLVAYYATPADYLLFRWTAATDAGAPETGRGEMVLVREGAEQVLATAGLGYVPGQWYRIGLRACRGELEALVDGQSVLTASTTSFGEGKPGLFAAGAGQADFDDVLVRRYESMQVADVAGESDWDTVRLTADATTAELTFGWQDGANYWRLRSSAEGAGTTLVLSRTQEGATETLARKQIPGPATGELALDVDGHYVRAHLGGRLGLDLVEPSLLPGRVAATGGDVRVASWDRAGLPSTITEQFTREASMSGWASAAGSWTPPSGRGRTRYFRAPLFGDCAIETEIDGLRTADGSVSIGVGGDGDGLETGYVTVLTATPGVDANVRLLRRGVEVASGTISADVLGAPGAPRLQIGGRTRRIRSGLVPRDGTGARGASAETNTLTMERKGTHIIVSMDEETVLAYADPEPLGGPEAGIRSEAIVLDFSRARASSDRLEDYTFARAPSDWWAGAGRWEVHDRWTCFPGWAWFSGSGDDVPILWSKKRYEGDMSFEFYCADIMDRRDFPGYSHPGDLSCTIGGDGKRVDSGYSLIFAGWQNRKTALLRKGRVVAETPSVRLHNPTNGNNAFHRHWFHIRVERKGSEVSVTIDGVPTLSFEDPDPLPGGHVALWTYNPKGGGILVARARVASENEPTVVSPMPGPLSDAEKATDVPRSLYIHPNDHEYHMVGHFGTQRG